MKRKFSIFWWDLNLVPLSYQVQCVDTWPSTTRSSKIQCKIPISCWWDLNLGPSSSASSLSVEQFFSPPSEWSGPLPPKGSEVFVGKVPRDVTEAELIPVFERIGPIFELRVMMNFVGCHRGFVFVRYTNREDARRAIRELNNFEIRWKFLNQQLCPES